MRLCVAGRGRGRGRGHPGWPGVHAGLRRQRLQHGSASLSGPCVRLSLPSCSSYHPGSAIVLAGLLCPGCSLSCCLRCRLRCLCRAPALCCILHIVTGLEGVVLIHHIEKVPAGGGCCLTGSCWAGSRQGRGSGHWVAGCCWLSLDSTGRGGSATGTPAQGQGVVGRGTPLQRGGRRQWAVSARALRGRERCWLQRAWALTVCATRRLE